MIKRLLLLAIIVELGLFWYVHQEKDPLLAADAPKKQIHENMVKNLPLDESTQVAEASTTTAAATLEEIKEKYDSEFSTLEKDTKKKAKELLKRAKADFIEESADGVAVLQVMGTYYNEFKTLEKETDDLFNVLYTELENELVVNGHSKEEALPYKKMYEEKKNELLKKALDVQGSYQ